MTLEGKEIISNVLLQIVFHTLISIEILEPQKIFDAASGISDKSNNNRITTVTFVLLLFINLELLVKYQTDIL